jgi:NAD(P)H-binding
MAVKLALNRVKLGGLRITGSLYQTSGSITTKAIIASAMNMARRRGDLPACCRIPETSGGVGRVSGIARTVTELLLKEGMAVRAMVRNEDERAQHMSAEVVVGDLFEPTDVYRIVNPCWRNYFGMSGSAAYLEVTVTMAAAARESGCNALVNMSQKTVFPMSVHNSTGPEQRPHWFSANVCLN